LSCPNNCGRSYKNKSSIGRHLKFECGVQPQFICYICHKRFTDKQSMKNKVESRYFCPRNCGRSYKNKCSVNQHLKFECGVEPQFICNICHKRFAYNKTKKKHLILVHNIFD
ncbi:zinc finger protein 586-like, partial [Aphis craccivora]